MRKTIEELLAAIAPQEWDRLTKGRWESNDAPKLPRLVIAPNRAIFEHWCIENRLRFRGSNPEAISATRPHQLMGLSNLAERLVMLGYPDSATGRDMREYVEVRLQIEKARANVEKVKN